jgi:hypothetical protein
VGDLPGWVSGQRRLPDVAHASTRRCVVQKRPSPDQPNTSMPAGDGNA